MVGSSFVQSSHDVVFGDPEKPVKLDDFRSVLIRQEETIIFALIERTQFPRNVDVYKRKSEESNMALVDFKGKYETFDGSFLDFFFSETEKLHALVRRYSSPDEHAFYPELLPTPILPSISYPEILKPNCINVNNEIMNVYLHKILPDITEDKCDSTSFGSTAAADVAVLQALSKRIHFGKFIAEAKFQAEKERYTKLILANDADGIMAALTNLAVEEKVIKRVKLKASTYGQDIDHDQGKTVQAEATKVAGCKVDPQVIANLYRDFVMPLTKEVQVKYLLERLAHPAISVTGVQGSYCWEAAHQHFGKVNESNFVESESISKTFSDVTSNRTAFGVVPLEDSSLGMIKETQSLLVSGSLKVCAEIVVSKSLICAAKTVLRRKDVSTVYVPSEMELTTLRRVEQLWPTAKVVVTASITEVAEQASNNPTSVALTSAEAAVVHRLTPFDPTSNVTSGASAFPLVSSLFSDETSFRRFVVIAKRISPSSGHDKSCLSMFLPHQVGSLLRALEVFKEHQINICCLESMYRRDHANGGFDFFVEIHGHIDDPDVTRALAKLAQEVCQVKPLGSFPVPFSREKPSGATTCLPRYQ